MPKNDLSVSPRGLPISPNVEATKLSSMQPIELTPLVSAFFLDLVNAVLIPVFMGRL